MNLRANHWKKLFVFCLGLLLAAGFCMKWMESDFWVNGEKFTILGLEFFYSREKVAAILSSLDGHVRTILGYHLYFDFAFMAGVFPGIASLCMIARDRLDGGGLRKLLFVVAALQLAAWSADIAENIQLLKWLKRPVIGDEFELFHYIVGFKFILVAIGLLSACLTLVLTWKRKR